MIKVGDLVYQSRKGGFIHDKSTAVKDRVGLVIKELREKGAIPQFYVQFNQDDPKWYHQHHLLKIGGERKEND